MPQPSAIPSARQLLAVAWMSILLGVLVEAAVLVVLKLCGKETALGSMVADTAAKVSWSFFVCVGIALGTAAVRMRPAAMGLLGVLAAPLAFAIAKAAHKSVAQAMAMAAGPAQVPGPIEMAVLRAVEYGVLGGVVGRLGLTSGRGLGHYAGVGAAVGLVAAGVVTTLAAHAGTDVPSQLVKGVNELLFPIGCSIVLYAANVLGRVAPHAP